MKHVKTEAEREAYAAEVDAERINQLEGINRALMAEVERLRKEYAILETQHQRVSAQADELLAITERLRRENERLRAALAIADEMAPSHTNITRAAE